MDNWYNTVGGRQFADRTVPKLIKAIEKLSENIEESNKTNKEILDKLTNMQNSLNKIEADTSKL